MSWCKAKKSRVLSQAESKQETQVLLQLDNIHQTEYIQSKHKHKDHHQDQDKVLQPVEIFLLILKTEQELLQKLTNLLRNEIEIFNEISDQYASIIIIWF
jgi:hypothetical protein